MVLRSWSGCCLHPLFQLGCELPLLLHTSQLQSTALTWLIGFKLALMCAGHTRQLGYCHSIIVSTSNSARSWNVKSLPLYLPFNLYKFILFWKWKEESWIIDFNIMHQMVITDLRSWPTFIMGKTTKTKSLGFDVFIYNFIRVSPFKVILS